MLPRLVNGRLSQHAHKILLVSRPQIARLPLPSNTFSLTQRTYALSRFPQRTTGTGRRRDAPLRKPSRPTIEETLYGTDGMKHEEKPSIDDWPTWQESVHRISRDPDDGLRRLLSHDTLVVTRSVVHIVISVILSYTVVYKLDK
jgi:hypothetical protein